MIPSTGGNFRFAATSPILENSVCTKTTLSAYSFNLSRAISSACGPVQPHQPSRGRAAATISIAWPPVPTVASTYVPSRPNPKPFQNRFEQRTGSMQNAQNLDA